MVQKIGPKNSPKIGPMVQRSNSPMVQSIFYPMSFFLENVKYRRQTDPNGGSGKTFCSISLFHSFTFMLHS